ncbi:hypothetical protein SNE40_012435 [Patella caerulea]|uniref:Peptidase M60 domain-containing protein n=1 Tax=Patella caerulea TaxID=87958 RepID=A0AAN8JPX1_PATCE
MNGRPISTDIGETWRKRLLDGVKFIPDRGLPGTVEVFGDNARPILMSTLAAPWMAAAEYGRGRVVVLAHAGYALKFETTDQDKNLARLHLNIKLWLTRGNYRDQSQICSLEQETLALKNKLILIIRGRTPFVKPDGVILNFVRRGGSLFHAMCPWGWLELHPGRTLSDMPYAGALEMIGISYQKSHWFMPKDGYAVCDYLATGIISTRPSTKKTIQNNRHRNFKSTSSIVESVGGEWRMDILEGVELVPNLASPGYLCVYGVRSHPILTEYRGTGTWMAAAEMGKGRILVMAHNSFMRYFESGHEHPDLARLMFNIQNWLTRGTYRDPSEVGCLQRGIFNLKTNKILIMRGRSQFRIPDEDLVKYIEGGGALLHAFDSFSWMLANPGKSLAQIPYANVLERAGIAYLEGQWNMPSTGLRVLKNVATDHHHIRYALQDVTNEISSKTLLLLMYLPKETLNQILDDLKEEIAYIESTSSVHCIPSVLNPVFSNEGRAMMGLTVALVKSGRINSKLPGLDQFPGDFEVRPNKFKMKVDIVSHVADVYPTGCYLRAGDEVTVIVQLEESLKLGWKMQIGCHSDRLHSLDSHVRWPYICETANIDKLRFKVTSLYGGLIYFISPGKPSAMEAVLSNVVEAPFFDLTNRSRVVGWNERRYAPGLWADMCGEFVCITVPSKSIRHIHDPSEVMRTWDDIISSFHHLRGSNVRKKRKQWIVTDIQSAERNTCLHAGYPIVTGLDLANPSGKNFLLNHSHIMAGAFWNVFAELGKNLQKKVWTFKGTENVTCNIFTLYAQDIICGIDPWLPQWLLSKIKVVTKYLEKDEGFYEWVSDPGLALFIYAQLVNQFGWGLYKRVFRKYRTLPIEELPQDNIYKMDFWFTAISQIARYNIAPLCDFWRIPLSTDVRNWLTQFPPFLPDDEITKLAPIRVQEITDFYGDVVRRPKRHVANEFHDTYQEPVRFKQPDIMTHIIRS